MNRLLNNFIFFISLILGIVLLPNFSYAQQDEPNRVNVLVVARELGRTVEIIQLPAHNLPLIARVKSSKYRSNTVSENREAYSSPSRSIAKAPTTKASTPAPVKMTTAAKPSLASSSKPEPPQKKKSTIRLEEKLAISQKNRTIEVTDNNASAPADKKVKEVVVTKEDVVVRPPVENKTIEKPVTKVVVENNVEKVEKSKEQVQSPEQLQAIHAAKVNAVNYIWIGAFLILAGLVLGLLFGKPAFLVSAAGLVFIVLGLMV